MTPALVWHLVPFQGPSDRGPPAALGHESLFFFTLSPILSVF